MTAFARQMSTSEQGQLTLEIKSVNHRFSEVSLRLPEDLRFLEPRLREAIAKRIQRGKVDCVVRYLPPELQSTSVQINRDLLSVLTQATQEIENLLPHSAPSRAVDFLKWPGVIAAPEQDMQALGEQLLAMLQIALEELTDNRRREGEQLKALILERCVNMEQEVERVKARLPIAIDAMRQRLTERLAELKSEMDEARVEQEMVLLVNKSDVAEEIDRLGAHIVEVRRVLEQNQAMGRRLDFLMQELNREANTLSSKSVDTEITRAAVELKVLIEQMREQVQNIE
ncbi:YicC/YloC family endoribonuclease [Kaarinaea lacus]